MIPGHPRPSYPSGVILDAARDAIVGAWRLVEYADRDSESDAWTPTFGTKPSGILLYHPSGLLSVQVSAATDEPSPPFRYVGYFGRYALREAEREGDEIFGVVEHHMEIAFPVELLDEGPERHFRVVSDRLMLGDGRTSRRLLERVI